MSILDLATGGLSYLRQNPMFLLAAARNAARLHVAVPLDLLRWAIDRRPRGKGPERIEISGSDGALGVALTVDLYGTKIDVSTRVEVESIENLADALRISLRVSDLDVKAPANSPAAQMIKAMDLSRPGNLMKMMPKRHAALVEATDDRFVIDLLQVPALAKNRTLRRLLAGLSDALVIRTVATEGDLLLIGLRVDPLSVPSALLRLRAG